MDSSSPNPLASHPVFRRWREDLDASRRWHEANPELAQAWEEALWEDEHWRVMQRRRRMEEEANMALSTALAAAGVPARCGEAVCLEVRDTPAIKAARAFLGELEERRTFLLLLGAAGTGKSMAAAWAVRERLWRDMAYDGRSPRKPRAYFARACDLARLSQYDREDQQRFRNYCAARLLVVDDLGAEQSNSNWLALLDELIDNRYGERLPTILTTNLDADQFKARYGERIADRIRHDGVIVGAGTESLRRRPA